MHVTNTALTVAVSMQKPSINVSIPQNQQVLTFAKTTGFPPEHMGESLPQTKLNLNYYFEIFQKR